MTRRLTLVVVLVLSVAVAASLALAATGGLRPASSSVPTGSEAQPPTADRLDPEEFLSAYVDPTGRVVRTDQGGDTVSEGQAYALLIALGTDDRATFASVWSWTAEHLRRPDGLLSWRFDGTAVADASSASDADLDAARALVLAGERFERPDYTRAGIALGTAVLDHETVRTPDGLVLVAGSWATDQAPYSFNPSYVSPVATDVLAEASGDPRWAELETGSRAAVTALQADGQLPPDWAELDEDGTVRPVSGPAGQPVQFGYDAARTLVRHAESCTPEDRELAADAAQVLARDGRGTVAVYDLAGAPRSDVASPLTFVAHAAGLAAGGDRDGAAGEIAAANGAQRSAPTYYGDAWTVLGPMLLRDGSLGGCPQLEQG